MKRLILTLPLPCLTVMARIFDCLYDNCPKTPNGPDRGTCMGGKTAENPVMIS